MPQQRENYISLAEGANGTPYSQEYLSLLVRKGRIPAKKFGRNWYTTPEAIRTYILKQQENLWKKIENGSGAPDSRFAAQSREIFPKADVSRLRLIRKEAPAFPSGRSPVSAHELFKNLDISGFALAGAKMIAAAALGAGIMAGGIFTSHLAHQLETNSVDISGAVSRAARDSRNDIAALGSTVAETSQVLFDHLLDQTEQYAGIFDSFLQPFRSAATAVRTFMCNTILACPTETRFAILPPTAQPEPEPIELSPPPIEPPPPIQIPISPQPAQPPPPPEIQRVREVIERRELFSPADTALVKKDILTDVESLNKALRDYFDQKIASLSSSLSSTRSTANSAITIVSQSQKIDNLNNTTASNGFKVGSGNLELSDGVNFISTGSVSASSLSLTGALTASAGTSSVAHFSAGNVSFGSSNDNYFIFRSGIIKHENQSTTTIPSNLLNAYSISVSPQATPLLTFDTQNTRIGVGTTTPYTAFSIAGAAGITGQLQLFSSPTSAHTFSSWVTNTENSNFTNASLLINPNSASSDTNLIGAGVNGQVRFLVDVEGDIFGRSLTTEGSNTLSTTSASSLTVEGNTTFGDAQTDWITFNTGTLIFNNPATTTLPTNTMAFTFSSSTTSVPLLVLDTTNYRVGVGTTSPSATLTASSTNSVALLIDQRGTQDIVRFLDAGVSRFALLDGGNIGISSSTPTARLSVTSGGTGTGRAFVVADSNNLERFTILDNGNVGIGYSQGLSGALVVNGNVGIGTVSPQQVLHVVGQCVTGDTRLRRRRRKRSSASGIGSDYQYNNLFYGTGDISLRESARMAAGYGFDGTGISYDTDIPQRGTLWTYLSSAARGIVNTLEYRRGSGTREQEGVQTVSADSPWFGIRTSYESDAGFAAPIHFRTGVPETQERHARHYSNVERSSQFPQGLNAQLPTPNAELYEYDEVRIVDIKEGDEILSLNEKTGLLEWQPVIALLDMGEKPVYRLTTQSGRTIRTTGNHPYLTKYGWRKVAFLAEGDEIAVSREEASASRVFGGVIERNDREHNRESNRGNYVESGIVHRYYSLPRMAITKMIVAMTPIIRYAMTSWFIVMNGYRASRTLINRQNTAAVAPMLNIGSVMGPTPAGIKYPITADATRIFDRSEKYSDSVSIWAFVKRIYAWYQDDFGDVKWEKIVSLHYVGIEHVWDVSVANTHNFIGNDIVAHNTYITNDLSLAGGDFNLGTGSATTTLTSASGNLGIGSTTPAQLLSVQGNALISGNLTSVANITATGTITHSAFPYTSLTASTELNDVNLNLARAVQFAAGTLATQRAVLIQAPTYSFTASSTLTDASTLLITGAPRAGASNMATSSYALKIDGGSVVNGSSATPLNAYALYVTAPTGATNNYGAIFATGNVGIGTINPLQVLHVVGQCVTGDTRLRRRRRKRSSEFGVRSSEQDAQLPTLNAELYEYDEVAIVDIKEGDEILSLDETTGTLVWNKVARMMAMGTKEIYTLTTTTGKTIRTTAEHPYLVAPSLTPEPTAIFVDSANFEISCKECGLDFDYKEIVNAFTAEGQRPMFRYYKVDFGTQKLHKFFDYLNILGAKIISKALKVIRPRGEDDFPKGNFDVEISFDAAMRREEYSTLVLFSGDSDFTYMARELQKIGKKIVVISSWQATGRELRRQADLFFDLREMPFVKSAAGNKKSPRRGRKTRLSPALPILSQVHPYVKGGVWKKVSELQEGQMISTVGANGKPQFERIMKIEKTGSEQVYDIQIANTHNFIGNDIVAHNTYITNDLSIAGGDFNLGSGSATTTLTSASGNLGIGTTTPGTFLSVQGIANFASGQSQFYPTLNLPIFNATSTTATSTIAGGLAIETSGFVYDYSSNRVGIGTAAPSRALTVVGSGIVSGGTDASTNFDIGEGGSSPSSARTAALSIDSASSGGAVGSSNINLRRASTLVWQFGIDSDSTTGIKRSVNDFFFYNNTDALYNVIFKEGGNALFRGSVGVGGVVNPIQALHVVGQCVTGDTRLRRRRRRKWTMDNRADGNGQWTIDNGDEFNSPFDDYLYDEVLIVDIREGDEILSLNEKTGLLEWQSVMALLDMGEKPVYALTTQSGRTIRTTGNHPYLTKYGWVKVSDLRKGNEIYVPTDEALSSAENRSRQSDNIFGYAYGKRAEAFAYEPLVKSNYLCGFYKRWEEKARAFAGALCESIGMASAFLSVGIGRDCQKNYVFLDAVERAAGNNEGRPFFDRSEVGERKGNEQNVAGIIGCCSGRHTDYPKMQTKVRSSSAMPSPPHQCQEYEEGAGENTAVLRGALSGSVLQLVLERVLETYQSYVTALAYLLSNKSDVVSDRIVSIDYLGYEHVWDVSIANTHNFIGNDIVAHNTYITNDLSLSGGDFNLGTGSATTTLTSASARLGIASTSPWGLFSVESDNSSVGTANPIFVVGDQGTSTPFLYVSGVNGRVGVASTSPLAQLSVHALGGTPSFAVGSSTTQFIIDPKGQVGIGNASPITDLHIRNRTVLEGVVNTQTLLGNNVYYDGANWRYIETAAASAVRLGATAGEISFYTLASGTGGSSISTMDSTAQKMTLDVNGSFGIGDSTPAALFVVGDGDLFRVDSSGRVLLPAGASGAGNLALSTTGDTNTGLYFSAADEIRVQTGGSDRVTINSGGNLGIGTINPLQVLHVVGQCVTGDTLLRIRRRRKGGRYKSEEADPDDNGYDFLTIPITEAESGDDVLSLDTDTGKFEYRRIKGLIDTGENEVFELKTDSGRSIETTGNHPYLARTRREEAVRAGGAVAFIDYANMKAWTRGKGLSVDLKVLRRALNDAGVSDVRFYYGSDPENTKIFPFFKKLQSFGYHVVTKPVQYFRITLSELLTQTVNARWLKALEGSLKENLEREASRLDREGIELFAPKANFDVEITVDALRHAKDSDIFILFSGDGDFTYLLKELNALGKPAVVVSGRKSLSGALMMEAHKFVTLERLGEQIPGLFAETQNPPKRRVLKNGTDSISALLGLSRADVDNAKACKPHIADAGFDLRWTPVSRLAIGEEIAVMASEVIGDDDGKSVGIEHGLLFERVVSIERMGRKQTYDIEVEGTHNFVAGHLLNKKTGKGLSREEEKGVLEEYGHDVVALEFNNWFVPGQFVKARDKDIEFGGIIAHNTYITNDLSLSGGDFNLGSGSATTTLTSSSGRLGIASTSPWGLFSVESDNSSVGTGNPIFVVGDQGTSTPFLYVSGNNGNVGIGTTSPAATFAVGGTGYFTGNVGIGVSGPSAIAPLHIKSGAGAGLIFADTVAATGDSGLSVGEGGTQKGFVYWDTSQSAFAIQAQSGYGLNFNTNASDSAKVVIQSGGNVGVGTLSPVMQFHDAGHGLFGLDLFVQGGDFNLGTGSATTTLTSSSGRLGIASTSPWGLFSVESDNSSVGTGNPIFVVGDQGTTTPFLTVSGNNGYVGIGTSTPGTPLAISAGGTVPALLINQTSTGDLINIQDGGSTSFIIKDGGNVGIGTAGPSYRLDIAEVASGVTTLRVGSGSADGAGNDKNILLHGNAQSSTVGGDLQISFMSGSNQVDWGIGVDRSAGGVFKISGGVNQDNDVQFPLGTNDRLTINTSGNLGIGTVNPLQVLHVVGQCVTGDTRLRRRRRKRSSASGVRGSEQDAQLPTPNAELYEYDEVRIVDIKAGDEIASLDEQTGKIVWSRVVKLMEMGKKQTYKLTTATGRQIRTTAEHPYLTPQGWRKVQELTLGMAVAAPRQRAKITYAFIDGANIGLGAEASGWKIDWRKLARYLATRFGVVRAFYFSGTSEKPERIELYEELQRLGFELFLVPTRRFSDGRTKADVDSRMTFEMMRMQGEYDRAVALTGDGDFYWVLEHLRKQKDRIALLSFGKRTARWLTRLFGTNLIDFETIRRIVEKSGVEAKEASQTPKVADAFDESATRVFRSYSNPNTLSRGGGDNKGQDIFFDRIISVTPVAEEQVYDIEVENTHNFIGNDIVAHNTYISNDLSLSGGDFNLGTGSATTTLTSSSGRLGIASTSPWGLFSVESDNSSVGTGNPIFVVGDQGTTTPFLTVSGNNGYVGIGTTTPGTPLAISAGGGVPALLINQTSTGDLINIQDGGSTAFIIKDGGNVGIGNTNPQTALHVGPGLDAPGFGTAANTLYVSANGQADVLVRDSTNDVVGGISAYLSGTGRVQVRAASNHQLRFATNNIEVMYLDTAGNLGIATTTPGSILSVQGIANFASGQSQFYPTLNLPIFNATSTTATSTIATGGFTIGTSQFVVQQNSGNVGIGTVNPLQVLHVVGQCVTGDTRLRRRRRKRSSASGVRGSEQDAQLPTPNAELYEYDEVRIVDIREGDEIASLDEATGKIVWSRVNGLMDMGIKTTYRLRTEDGKEIRTTENHPYLTKHGWQKVSFLREGMEIAVSSEALGEGRTVSSEAFSEGRTVAGSRFGPNSGFLGFKNRQSAFESAFIGGQEEFSRAPENHVSGHPFDVNDHQAMRTLNIESFDVPEVFVKSEENTRGLLGILKKLLIGSAFQSDFNGPQDVMSAFAQSRNRISVDAVVSENLHGSIMNEGMRNHPRWFFRKPARELKSGNNIVFGDAGVLGGDFVNGVASRHEVENISHRDSRTANAGFAETDVGVDGDSFHTSYHTWSSRDVKWERIAAIEYVTQEPVYDIEVEGTHNFIGNDIVAHNTYITSDLSLSGGDFNLGSGSATTTLTSASGRLGIASTSPWGLFSVESDNSSVGTGNPIFVVGDQGTSTPFLYVSGNNGRVGIGTANPRQLLEIGAGTGDAAMILNSASASTAVVLFHRNSTEAGRIAFSSSADMAFQMGSGATEYMRLTSSGNLGIGTVNPLQVLHVVGNQITTLDHFIYGGDINLGTGSATTTLTSSSGRLGIASTSPWGLFSVESDNSSVGTGNPIFVVGDQGTTTPFLTVSGNNGYVGIGTTTPGTPLAISAGGGVPALLINQTSTGDLINIQDGGSTAFIIKDGGNVGIGTAGPRNTLHIRSTEPNIIVDESDAGTDEKVWRFVASGGDFVFQAITDDYDFAGNNTDIFKVERTGRTVDRLYFPNGNVGIGTTTPVGLLSVEMGAQSYPFWIGDTGTSSVTFFLTGNNKVGIMASSTTLASTNIPTGSVVIGMGALCVDDGGSDASGDCDNAARTRGNIYAVATTITGIDVAERYPTKDTTLEPGDIVMVDPERPVFVTKAKHTLGEVGLPLGSPTSSGAPAILGAVSTKPGITLGGFGFEDYKDEITLPIALSGRIPVKVNLEGGDIKPGDRIALSSVAGVGMRFSSASGVRRSEQEQTTPNAQLPTPNSEVPTIGIALEGFDGHTGTGEFSSEGKIMVFVNLGYSKIDEHVAEVGLPDGSPTSGDAAFWSVNSSGKLTTTYGLDLSNQDIVNVRSILSAGGKWSIDENGLLVVQEVRAQKLCLGETCVTEQELKRLLEKAGITQQPEAAASSEFGVGSSEQDTDEVGLPQTSEGSPTSGEGSPSTSSGTNNEESPSASQETTGADAVGQASAGSSDGQGTPSTSSGDNESGEVGLPGGSPTSEGTGGDISI